jgi:hypothetical protein
MTWLYELMVEWMWHLQLYVLLGFASLVVLRLGTWIVNGSTKSEKKQWEEFLQRPGDVKPWQKTAKELLQNFGVFIAFLFIWPVILLILLVMLIKGPDSHRDPEPEDKFDCKLHSLRRKVTPVIAEAEAIIVDPKGRVPSKPFGHLHEGWKKFLNQGEPGDDLWTFTLEGEAPYRPADVPWTQRDGRKEGFAWVRDGKVKAEFLIEWG